jgi:hypothetical protein
MGPMLTGKPTARTATERRWNRTIQAEGCSALPVSRLAFTSLVTIGGPQEQGTQAVQCRVLRQPQCDSSLGSNGMPHGEGRTPLGSIAVTTNDSGIAEFATTVVLFHQETRSVTATATDEDGNTSEFSSCLEIK